MRKTLFSMLVLTAALGGLTACSAPYSRPDHRIGVMQNPATGETMAIAKNCPEWHQHPFDGLENYMDPQVGCFDYYNLAHEVERPGDLVEGRKASAADAAPGVLGIERYRSDKTKQLINPKDIPATTKQ